MSRGTDGETLYPETLVIAPGASLKISPIAGQLSVLLKYLGISSSLYLSNVTDPKGSSASIATNYLFSYGEVLSFDMTGSFYLSSVGVTSTCYLIRVRTAGTGN